MDLQELRLKINTIDDQIRRLFLERMECSKGVAETKMASEDEVYKPIREKEILERVAGDNNSLAVFWKKLIALSRKQQYHEFLDRKKNVDGFFASITEEQEKAFCEGGNFTVSYLCDPEGLKALTLKEMVAVVTDTSLEVLSIEAKGNKVSITVNVNNNDKDKEEAMLLSYMLYKESLHI